MTIKTEYTNFIKMGALNGQPGKLIKKELDEMYGKTNNDLPCLNTVYNYMSRFNPNADSDASKSNKNRITKSPDLESADKNATKKHYFDCWNESNMIDEKYRTFIENGVQQSKSLKEIKREFWTKYGRISSIPINKWFYRFKAYETARSFNHQFAAASKIPQNSLDNNVFESQTTESQMIYDQPLIKIETLYDNFELNF